MCGVIVVAGDTGPRMSAASVAASLHHRGPDSHGYQAVQCGGLLFEFGHTRLAIQDLSEAGAQPMWSADGRWLISFNGEIYNHRDLRTRLASRHGTTFRGHSDTETLVELIAREGIDSAVSMLDGMFAFVALDRASGSLHAARDAAGVKPLYFLQSGRGVAFASEVRGLTAHGFDPGTPDPAMISLYLRLRYVPAPGTLHRDLRKVPAGTIVSWRSGTLTQRPFEWRGQAPEAGQGRSPLTESKATAEFGRLLVSSVQAQLISDVPVGVLLSGGLDSAVLAAALSRKGIVAPCFTVGFESDADGRSEIEDARETARLLGLPHHALVLSTADLVGVEGQAMDHLEEPLGTTSVLAMWHLCKLARSQVTVALAGQGADEPLGGYRRHRLEALRSGMPGPARRLVAGLVDALPARHDDEKLRAARALGTRSWLESYVGAREVFGLSDLAALGAASPPDPSVVFGDRLAQLHGRPDRSSLAASLWLDVRTQLADDLLLYGDKLAMAHSLEVRVPYLGAELLATMEQLPDRQRTAPWESKRILRAWARTVLPQEVIDRRKRGFLIPNLFNNVRFLAESKDRIQARLGPEGLGFDADRLAAFTDAGARGGAHEVRAWTLHSLARWLERFVSRDTVGEQELARMT